MMYNNQNQIDPLQKMMQEYQQWNQNMQQQSAMWQQKINNAKNAFSQIFTQQPYQPYQQPQQQVQPQEQQQAEVPPHVQQLTVMGELKEAQKKTNELLEKLVAELMPEQEEIKQSKNNKNESNKK